MSNERTIQAIVKYMEGEDGPVKEKKILDYCEEKLRFFSPNKVRGVLQHTPDVFTQVNPREWALTNS